MIYIRCVCLLLTILINVTLMAKSGNINTLINAFEATKKGQEIKHTIDKKIKLYDKKISMVTGHMFKDIFGTCLYTMSTKNIELPSYDLLGFKGRMKLNYSFKEDRALMLIFEKDW